MPVMSDRWIIEMALKREMIKPFSESQVRRGISFGVSSYGYDMSLSDEFRLLDPSSLPEIDPKKDLSEHFTEIKAESIQIPANSFVLGRSREYFKIPRDIITICTGKSTYARSGVIVNVTPFEPEWEGFATISISNTAPVPTRVYAGEGIAQLIFLQAAELCEQSYRDKKGKYQAQKGITMSKSD
ncbi:MAG: dCTP deaminase [Candidatus Zixiibacteriota bacterium]|nr:MAG: dCTP deaminase [candidate division Zixibacteria bacterium]